MINIICEPYRSIEVETKKGNVVISEGDNIQFTTESGEIHIGNVSKFKGKGEKLEITILSTKKECKEVWKAVSMTEGSLKLYNGEGG